VFGCCERIALLVTAGILKGDRARFQLFGDTVNVASRMESTGHSNMIQGSQSTATLLIEADKGHWVSERPDVIHAKGKGSKYWKRTKK
jgi:class 3 adenylate cyclase